MPVTYDAVREWALALPGVTEGKSYGTPSLHVGKKLLARLREDGETIVLKVGFERRDELITRDPDTFYTTDHYRDYPTVLVNLLAVRVSELPALLEEAWRQVASKRQTAAFDLARRA